MQLLIELLEYALLISLIGAGLFLTFRLGFLQLRKLGHSIAVTMGRYEQPGDVGDVSHFQALSTALAATVGIGNIAGVAIAIHWAGPGAVFWMWVTAFLGAAIKFTEVTLALKHRSITPNNTGSGTVSGGAMYYIEKGLGPQWKPLAIFVAFSLMLTAIVTGNAVQANTIADIMDSEMQIPVWITGLVTAVLVGRVVLGGIQDIVTVTKYLVPIMACLYVLSGISILLINHEFVVSAFQSIISEAFNPVAGVAGTGIGVFFQTLLWGVKRGLLSNESGQASAPIAHAAAKTSEPVSEGTVALLEPFIDTIIICTITALVILTTGVWKEKVPTVIEVANPTDAAIVQQTATGFETLSISPDRISFQAGVPTDLTIAYAWHEIPIDTLYVDAAMRTPFDGDLFQEAGTALGTLDQVYPYLYGRAVENGAPLTMQAFSKGLGPIGKWIVILSVFLFGVSTAISWNYYGDRCVLYLWGEKYIRPYQIVYVILHFVGATFALNAIWAMADVVIALVTIPNVIVLVVLSGKVRKYSQAYFGKIKSGEIRRVGKK